MPYITSGKCVYKKKPDGSRGKKVGCTEGSVKDYLAALHMHADESKEPADMEAIMESWRKFLKEAAKDYVWGVKGIHRMANKFGGWVPIKRKMRKKKKS
jgi:hypothetical protein